MLAVLGDVAASILRVGVGVLHLKGSLDGLKRYIESRSCAQRYGRGVFKRVSSATPLWLFLGRNHKKNIKSKASKMPIHSKELHV